MSKYDGLWAYISGQSGSRVQMTFEEIGSLGSPIDHSFLTCKKELLSYGWQVGKISMRKQTVEFSRVKD